ncbi:unnamed protein product, partial [Protopolystoma xenopodis]
MVKHIDDVFQGPQEFIATGLERLRPIQSMQSIYSHTYPQKVVGFGESNGQPSDILALGSIVRPAKGNLARARALAVAPKLAPLWSP